LSSPAACVYKIAAAARNVPTSKRSTAVGIITAASYAGTALAFGISPLLISRFGWQWVFYLFGGSALLWLPFWLPLNVLKQLPEDAAAAAAGAAGTSSSAAASAPQQQQQQQQGKDSPLSQSALGGDEGAPLLQRQSFELAAASTPAAAAAADGSTGFQALLRRREVWAICVCQYAQSYGMYGLLTWLPTFFTDYYGVKLVDLGGYTLLPYVLQVGGCDH
jgi:ACS family sodium-dependent inorganic phosphate cotransporter